MEEAAVKVFRVLLLDHLVHVSHIGESARSPSSLIVAGKTACTSVLCEGFARLLLLFLWSVHPFSFHLANPRLQVESLLPRSIPLGKRTTIPLYSATNCVYFSFPITINKTSRTCGVLHLKASSLAVSAPSTPNNIRTLLEARTPKARSSSLHPAFFSGFDVAQTPSHSLPQLLTILHSHGFHRNKEDHLAGLPLWIPDGSKSDSGDGSPRQRHV
jgi:hypothetical protein